MKRSLTLLAGAIALLAPLAAARAAATGQDEAPIVRYDRESRYYRIRVVDYPDRGRRCMRFSKPGAVQSSMILADPQRLDLRHGQSMMAALALPAEVKDVLLVGLGGASIPKFIQKHFPAVRLDVVEVDPDVVKVCQEWFEFKGAPGTQVIVMDGRMYLKRSARTYDLVLLDAYAADHIPFHLTTLEFLQLVKSRLKPGGAVAANLWEPGVVAAGRMGPPVSRFYLAELKTFQTAFAQTYLCKSGAEGKIIVFGSLAQKQVTADDWAGRAETLVAGKDVGFDLAGLIRAEYEYLATQQIKDKPLTDDMAPVDTLRHENPKTFEEGPGK
jgi:spermidine synthase